MNKRLAIGLSFFWILALPACQKKDQTQLNNALSTIQQGARQGVDAVKDTISQTQADYLKSAQNQIDQVSASIDDLKKKSKTADIQVKSDLDRTVAGLQARRDALQQKLNDVKSSTTDAWKDMAAGINDSLDDLRKAAQAAQDRFK